MTFFLLPFQPSKLRLKFLNAEERNSFSSCKRETSQPSALKSYFKDESYRKRVFEVMLPQAQRSSIDLRCRCVQEMKLSELHLAYMAKMHTVDVQLKYLLFF